MILPLHAPFSQRSWTIQCRLLLPSAISSKEKSRWNAWRFSLRHRATSEIGVWNSGKNGSSGGANKSSQPNGSPCHALHTTTSGAAPDHCLITSPANGLIAVLPSASLRQNPTEESSSVSLAVVAARSPHSIVVVGSGTPVTLDRILRTARSWACRLGCFSMSRLFRTKLLLCDAAVFLLWLSLLRLLSVLARKIGWFLLTKLLS